MPFHFGLARAQDVAIDDIDSARRPHTSFRRRGLACSDNSYSIRAVGALSACSSAALCRSTISRPSWSSVPAGYEHRSPPWSVTALFDVWVEGREQRDGEESSSCHLAS